MSKPTAPRIGTATIVGTTTSVNVTWTKLTATGILSYQLQSLPVTTTATATSTASTATFRNLTRGVAYKFRVAGVNSAGIGIYSSYSNTVTIPLTTPSSPTISSVGTNCS